MAVIIRLAQGVVKQMREPTAPLHQINNKSLKDRIVSVLRDAILSGDMRPGQPLIEMEIAAQLGVSRAPLREALQILNTEGLLETIPYHGTTVRKLNKTDIEELYSLRSVLETFAVRRLIAHNDPDHVNQLRQIYTDMMAAADEEDVNKVSEIDRVFHDALIQLSGHTLLFSTWNVVALRVRQIMALRNKQNSDIKQIARNHLPIIEAIAQGDEIEAVRLIEAHVASAGDLIAEYWDDVNQEIKSE